MGCMNMSFQKRTLAWGLFGLVAIVGAALAAEPIFVTPPDGKTSTVPERPADPLANLPLAKTYPDGQTRQSEQPPTGSLPVFVAPPPAPVTQGAPPKPLAPATPSAEVTRPEPAQALRESVEKRPPERAPVVVERAVFITQDAGKEESEADAGEPIVDIRFGLGLKPLKVKTGLPPEIGILQTALAKTVDNTELFPEQEALRALCADAEKIGDLTNELGRTPLIEVTTHFTLWRDAMEQLSRSVAAYQQQCVKPSAASVKSFQRVLDDFAALLTTR